MTDFKNKNVLITGAASGLGRLMAEKIGGLGNNLFLWDVNAEGLKELSAELKAKGNSVFTYAFDLTDRPAVYATAKKVLEDGGHIDVLINDAGVVSGKPILEASDEDILLTFKVNTLALFWTTHAFLPSMVKRNSGHIVTVASAAGIVGTPKLVDYSSSKHAAVGFDEALRLELKRQKLNIRTTVVCPYYIDTGMFEGVKTRFPLLLPILKPEYVVNKIIRAIRKNHRRLVMPRFVMISYLARLFPIPVFDFLIDFFGINRTMDDFIGREGH